MAAARKLRLGQFSLLSLFVVLTLSSISCGVLAYRQMREAYEVDIVKRFNAAIDDEQYDLADSIANEMLREFPENPVAEMMAWKASFARVSATGNKQEREDLYRAVFR